MSDDGEKDEGEKMPQPLFQSEEFKSREQELEDRLRMMILAYDNLKEERDVILRKLANAEVRIERQKKKISTLQDDSEDLNELRLEYRSLKAAFRALKR